MTPTLPERITLVLAECERILADPYTLTEPPFKASAVVAIENGIQAMKYGCMTAHLDVALEQITSPFSYLWEVQP